MKKYLAVMPRVLIAVFLFGSWTLASSEPGEAAGPYGAALYIVRYGDTLESIASRFGVPVRVILEANGWGTPRPYYPVGVQMHVPYGYGVPSYGSGYGSPYGYGSSPYVTSYPSTNGYGSAPYGTGYPATNGYGSSAYGTGYSNPSGSSYATSSYIVQNGDTLSSIAARHGVSVYTLMRLNYIYNPNFIYAGMRLIVPQSAFSAPSSSTTYLVQLGDTLTGIALRFGTSVYALAIANNIPNPNLIFAGSTLVIPSGSGGYGPPSSTYPSAGATPGPTSTPLPGLSGSISLQSIAYNPKTVTIHVGTQVTWTNNEPSAIPHTVTSGSPGAPSGTFDSPTLNPGQTFQFTFSSAGTIAYYCRIHGAAMTGTIQVIP